MRQIATSIHPNLYVLLSSNRLEEVKHSMNSNSIVTLLSEFFQMKICSHVKDNTISKAAVGI